MAELGGYLERHWQGKLPLWQSYWINAVGASFAVFTAGYVLHPFASGKTQAVSIAMVGALLWPMTLVLVIWQIVGIWRSANLYAQTSPTPVWSHLARAVVVLSLLGTASHLTIGASRTLDLLDALRGDPALSPEQIAELPGGAAVEFDGTIRFGSARRLEHILREAPHAQVLYLSTPGGRVAEAEKIADVVRSNHLSTYVDQICASAGTVVFLAGKSRVLNKAGRLGFHSARSSGALLVAADRSMAAALKRVGASPAFIARVLSTPSSSIWYPSLAELLREGVITRYTDGRDFAFSLKDRAGFNEPLLRRLVLKNRVLAQINSSIPEKFEAALRLALMRIRQGAVQGTCMEPFIALQRQWLSREMLQPSHV